MVELTEDEEEVIWARDALEAGDLTVADIVEQSRKPIDYWRRKLGNDRLRVIARGRPKKDPKFPTLTPEQVWNHIKHDGMTVTTIARRYGVSKSRISQLKNRGY